MRVDKVPPISEQRQSQPIFAHPHANVKGHGSFAVISKYHVARFAYFIDKLGIKRKATALCSITR
jgi:hypothetical protein